MDLIDRKEAINYFFRPYSNEESYSNTDVEQILKSLPAVNTPPIGKWQILQHNKQFDVFRCDQCGYSQLFLSGFKSNYCPSCGSEMR